MHTHTSELPQGTQNSMPFIQGTLEPEFGVECWPELVLELVFGERTYDLKGVTPTASSPQF